MALWQKRVLLCEDNTVSADIICHMLLSKGMYVDWAENGQVGIEMFSDSLEKYYDIILMDIMMPVLNGIKTSIQIRNLSRVDARSVIIIALTANDFMDNVTNNEEAGVRCCITKPINERLLFKLLDECWNA